jgi:diaminopimelate decarboxylase
MSLLPPLLSYQRQALTMENVVLSSIVRDVGTPVYVYSRRRILDNFHSFNDAFHPQKRLVLFAVKANSTGAVLSVLAKAGAGADIVSVGELFRALRAGIPAGKIVFSGVGKRQDEIKAALDAGILLFNVESVEELYAIEAVASALRKTAPVSIRVNPDVDAETHDHITTGKKENKFGVPIGKALAVCRLAARFPHINLLGIQAHIGSQIIRVDPYVKTLKLMLEITDRLVSEGMELCYLDIGGGLGVRYRDEKPPEPKHLAQAMKDMLGDRPLTLLMEPGRYLVADAGLLLTQVLYRKDVGGKHFIVVDAAMNDLARPALYDAYHSIYPLARKKGRNVTADIVGPICETGDYLARRRKMPLPDQQEYLAVATAGAYGFVMGSQYNSRPRPPEVMVHGDKWTVVRDRETLNDLVRGEHIP